MLIEKRKNTEEKIDQYRANSWKIFVEVIKNIIHAQNIFFEVVDQMEISGTIFQEERYTVFRVDKVIKGMYK